MANREYPSKIFSFVQNVVKKALYLYPKIVRYGWRILKAIWATNKLNIIMLFLTTFAVFLVFFDIPNYPFWATDKIPTRTYSYIDTGYGNYVSYEVDYTIKYRKWNLSIFPLDYDISISLPKKVNGYKDFKEEVMGRKIDIRFDAPNDTIK